MSVFRWYKRCKQSKGYDVHSPFAFNLITRIINSPHYYYSFFDIPDILAEHGVEIDSQKSLNHISFRLVLNFNPNNVLEVNVGQGVNTLFISAASPNTEITVVESGETDLSLARILLKNRFKTASFVSSTPSPEEGCYDAIFIYLEKDCPITVDEILNLGHEKSFWVIHAIRKGKGKQIWRNIVNDKRITVTIETKDIGVAFSDPSMTPSNYLI